MERVIGLLRVRVIKGVNLAVRDIRSSDPYVVLTMGKQKLKTRVIEKNVNPVWNEELTFSISHPILPVKLNVYDKDIFSRDDKMGDAEFEIESFMESVRLNLEGVRSGTVIRKVAPCRQNCLAEESLIRWVDGKVIQDLCLRLRNVECGEVELQLEWINVSRSMGI
ncbi:hypothetical protein AMTRI_Chr12g234790 [Amborella trichopoda]|uniref:C2 domain-containing protein n=1 Tax=Amborella trichopoda TaxID=13333 RepID=W1PBZ4_AMBTC|nr:protein C2-DOMAIN ABA-RELATED 4 [Amborella trichopoda]ERN05468.1 hypothetical protein AMTR_s00007p00249830 [Amborella trichopoda]|eukprot:XP_006843793.1 protein C2-DOMAIN ABA-RELATED 4 [Amborella trichopoda]